MQWESNNISKERKVIIKVELSGEMSRKFANIKSSTGINTNAEVIRYCIQQVHEGNTIYIPPSLLAAIQKIVINPKITSRYAIFDSSDFLVRAASRFIQDLLKEI